MLRIDGAYLQRLHEAQSHDDLAFLLQKAVELEHATIPPYLTAMMSLKPGRNREVWDVVQSVVVEEMLHMTIASNVLNALGGDPAIDHPDFVPTYPGPLPMGIADGLTVGLEPYSPDLARTVFMEIEEPEEPFEFSDHLLPEPEMATIGLFYGLLQRRISELPGTTLPGDPARQVVYPDFYPADELFPVTTKDEAVRAIEMIIEQGEGSPNSPVDAQGDYAHYYRFEELAVRRRLVPDASSPQRYSFTGEAIPFTPDDVWPIVPNTRSADLPEGTYARRLADRFNLAYRRLLKALHRTFNGEPEHIASSLSIMYDVKLIAERLVALPHPGHPGRNVGPPFEYGTLEP